MMATRGFTATTTPTALPGVVVGTGYTMQNVDPSDRLFVAITSAPPTRTDPAFVLQPGEVGTARADAGDSIYVWSARGSVALVVDETA